MCYTTAKPHHKCAVTCAKAKHTSTVYSHINYPWFTRFIVQTRTSSLLLVFMLFFRVDGLTYYESLTFFFGSTRLEIGFYDFSLYLYILVDLCCRALNRQRWCMRPNTFGLFRHFFSSFSSSIPFREQQLIDVYDLLVLISPPLSRSSESGLQTRLLEILQLHQIAFLASRTTRRSPTTASSRIGRAHRMTSPTASSWLTLITTIAGDRRMIRMFHLTIDYRRPRNNAWY